MICYEYKVQTEQELSIKRNALKLYPYGNKWRNDSVAIRAALTVRKGKIPPVKLRFVPPLPYNISFYNSEFTKVIIANKVVIYV